LSCGLSAVRLLRILRQFPKPGGLSFRTHFAE
jgi:hypothetical protein